MKWKSSEADVCFIQVDVNFPKAFKPFYVFRDVVISFKTNITKERNVFLSERNLRTKYKKYT